MGRVRVTMLPWKSNKYYTVCAGVCSLSYPECKAHAYYTVVCGLPGCTFSTLPYKWHDFRETKYRVYSVCLDFLNNCVFLF